MALMTSPDVHRPSTIYCSACGGISQLTHAATTEQFACPTCGLRHPTDAFMQRLQFHGMATMLGGFALATAFVLYTMQLHFAASMVAFFGVMVAAGSQYLRIFGEQVDSREADLLEAKDAVEAGLLAVDLPGITDDVSDPTAVTDQQRQLAQALTFTGMIFLALPALELCCGWPENTSVQPTYISPGDVVRISLPNNGLASVGGDWRGTASAIITDASGAMSSAATALPNADYRDGSSRSMVSISNLAVDVTIPDRADYVGQTLTVDVRMRLEYRCRVSCCRVDNKNTTVTTQATLHIAPIGAGPTYRTVSLASLTAGSFAYLLLAGLLLQSLWAQRPRFARQFGLMRG